MVYTEPIALLQHIALYLEPKSGRGHSRCDIPDMIPDNSWLL